MSPETLEINSIDQISESLINLYPRESSKIMNTLPPEIVSKIISKLSPDNVRLLWPYFPPLVIDNLANFMSEAKIIELSHILDEIEFSLLIRKCTDEKRKSILNTLEKDHLEHQKSLLEYINYPEDTAGSLMRSNFYAFFEDQSVKEVAQQIKNHKKKSVSVVYIIDNNLRLKGFVNIYKILIANESEKLSKLAKPILTAVNDLASLDEVVDIIRSKPMHDLPVVDSDNKLIGVIDSPSLLENIQDDAYKDLQTMVGVSKDERALSPFLFSVSKRLPWLEINLLTAFLAASVVGLFEGLIAQFTALAVLLPVVAGQSGNAGAQALAVTMRGLTLREVTSKKWLTLMFKELKIGFISGICVALTCAAGVYLWSRSIGLCLVIGCSMIIAMVIACIAGAAVPLVLKKLGQDPAQSSSIILSTVTDVCGFFAFLGVATMLSSML